MMSSERLVVLGGMGLGAASLVPWYEADEFRFGGDGTRTNGWQQPDAMLSVVATIVGVVLAVVVIAVGRGGHRPTVGGMSWGTGLTAGGVVVFGLVALKFALNTDSTTYGIYLALVAAATVLYGAYVTQVEEAPAAGAVWPETSYFLSAWLRPGADPTAAAAAYRTAFASDVARLGRLAVELRSLLGPARPESERVALVGVCAPHVPPAAASAVLAQVAQAMLGTAR